MSSPEHPPAPPPDSVTATAPANAPADGSPAGIQAAPEAPAGPVPLPPPAPRPAPPPPDPARLARRVGFLDDLLVLLVLVFAFLLASFLATNSDLWMHLASGRLLARGEYEFGKDPFTFTAENVYWANHAWLFDLVAYGMYRVPRLGPTLLVVVKALLVALLSALMLRTSHRPGGRWWLPGVCVALAVLVMAPRLLVQPVVVSYLLLGVTLWLLVGGRRRAEGGASPGWRWWLVPAVCLLWVNVDSWFVLGPVTVALFLAGELLQWQLEPGESGGAGGALAPGRLRTLALVLGLAVVACLVNPHHVRAFMLPPALGLGGAAGVLREDPQFRMFSLAPWQGIYFQRGVGLNGPGMAYFVLLALGLLSFVLLVPGLLAPGQQAGRWRWWRLLVWLGFALLGGFQALSIPFFAVVAGPITALNLADFASGWLGDESRLGPAGRRWAVGGRLLTLLALAGLLVATVPGWVQAWPSGQSGRWRVAWGVAPDQSLRDAALRVKSWREEGRIEPGQRWFNTAPEVVNYLAWYCPGERGALDYRLELFGEVAPDWLKVRNALAGQGQAGERERTATRPDGSVRAVGAWEPVLRRRKVHFLFFHAYDLPRLATTMTRVYADHAEWKPCYLEGQTAILGWVDPDRPGQAREFAGLAIDFEARAFGPNAERAPDTPAAPPRARRWWEAPWAPAPPRSVDDGTAFQYEARFSGLLERYNVDHQLAWLGDMAGALVGSAGGFGGPAVNGMLVPLRVNHTYARVGAFMRREAQPDRWDQRSMQLLEGYVAAQDAGPPSALYLAVRAARRAFAAGSEEPRTGVLLAQAYLWLHRRTREFSRTQPRGPADPGFPHVRLIRQTQAAYALHRALRLGPPPEVAAVCHVMLAEDVYGDPEYFELRVKHLKEYVRLSRALKGFPGLPREDFPRQLEEQEKRLRALERDLRGKQDQYEIMSANKRVLEKARIAVRQGLAETALNLLLQADVEKELTEGRDRRLRTGATLEVYLLLGMGRLEEAAEALTPDPQADRPIDKDSFGVHPVDQAPRRLPGARAYEFFRVQLAAGLGDYAAADKYLAELYEQVAQTPLVYRVLEQMDAFPVGRAGEKAADARLLAAAGLGQILLREAAGLTGGVPARWVVRKFPYRLQTPVRRVPGWMTELGTVSEFSHSLIDQQADLLTLRGWLALEAGDTKAARTHLDKALALATFAAGKGRPAQRAILRSQGLAQVCLDLLRSGQGKK